MIVSEVLVLTLLIKLGLSALDTINLKASLLTLHLLERENLSRRLILSPGVNRSIFEKYQPY